MGYQCNWVLAGVHEVLAWVTDCQLPNESLHRSVR